MKLEIGQTWQLLSGEIVTIISLPNEDGWLRALSHDLGVERTYNLYGFVQAGARLLETKTAASLRVMIKELVLEALNEQKPKKRRRK